MRLVAPDEARALKCQEVAVGGWILVAEVRVSREKLRSRDLVGVRRRPPPAIWSLASNFGSEAPAGPRAVSSIKLPARELFARCVRGAEADEIRFAGARRVSFPQRPASDAAWR